MSGSCDNLTSKRSEIDKENKKKKKSSIVIVLKKSSIVLCWVSDMGGSLMGM